MAGTPDQRDDRVGVSRPAAGLHVIDAELPGQSDLLGGRPRRAAGRRRRAQLCPISQRRRQTHRRVHRGNASRSRVCHAAVNAMADQLRQARAATADLTSFATFTGAAAAPADRLPPGDRHAVSRQRRRRLLHAAASAVRSAAAGRAGQVGVTRRPRHLPAGLRRRARMGRRRRTTRPPDRHRGARSDEGRHAHPDRSASQRRRARHPRPADAGRPRPDPVGGGHAGADLPHRRAAAAQSRRRHRRRWHRRGVLRLGAGRQHPHLAAPAAVTTCTGRSRRSRSSRWSPSAPTTTCCWPCESAKKPSAGLGTGIIRSFAATGGVVTTAGIVFGITMFALAGSSVLSIAQIGVTIGVGLMLDTLIVRTFVLPSLVALLGRWFWWPRQPINAAWRVSPGRSNPLEPSRPASPAASSPGRWPPSRRG